MSTINRIHKHVKNVYNNRALRNALFFSEISFYVKSHFYVWIVALCKSQGPNGPPSRPVEAAADGAHPVAGGGRPAGVSRRPAGSGGVGLHGSHHPEEAAVGGHLQPQSTGSRRSPDGDGQRA